MVDLPQKKVGIVACSGEELALGSVTRQAALQVLETLRPKDTVTICLPLFLAGGEGDRAFARFYPTIAVDGCELRCAARATELHSGKPAASIVVSDLLAEAGLDQPQDRRRLDAAGQQAADLTAQHMADLVDELLGQRWSRRSGEFIPLDQLAEMPLPAEAQPAAEPQTEMEPEPVEATCACGSGIPVQKVLVNGKKVRLLALPLIFEQLHEAGKAPEEGVLGELLESVGVYNHIPEEGRDHFGQALLQAYRSFCQQQEVQA